MSESRNATSPAGDGAVKLGSLIILATYFCYSFFELYAGPLAESQTAAKKDGGNLLMMAGYLQRQK